jgi:glycerol-3-phosphate cytidylyltransferase
MRVITLGTFDLFHLGHLKLLRRCRMLAGNDGLVTVGLNTDEFIFRYKGWKPVMNYNERSLFLRHLPYVDQVLPNNQSNGSISSVVLESGSSMIVIGSDWGRKDYLKQIGLTWEWLEKNEVSLTYVPHTPDVSTTFIKERLWPVLPSPSSPTTDSKS